jgi:hypothetical protein
MSSWREVIFKINIAIHLCNLREFNRLGTWTIGIVAGGISIICGAAYHQNRKHVMEN